MRISCHNCHQIWQLAAGTMNAARLKFGMGSQEQVFVCPDCQAENIVTKQAFDTHDPQIPVPGKPSPTVMQGHPPRADNDPASAPINPVAGPDPSSSQIHAIVLDKGLRLLREHNRGSEVMGSLRKDEHVIILDTWTNGEDTWIQLGPERWALIEENGKALIQLLSQ